MALDFLYKKIAFEIINIINSKIALRFEVVAKPVSIANKLINNDN
jgi:hypothetical protein